MYEQVENLLFHAEKKLGFKSNNSKGGALFKFFKENPRLEHVYIPINSFDEYVTAYNREKEKI